MSDHPHTMILRDIHMVERIVDSVRRWMIAAGCESKRRSGHVANSPATDP